MKSDLSERVRAALPQYWKFVDYNFPSSDFVEMRCGEIILCVSESYTDLYSVELDYNGTTLFFEHHKNPTTGVKAALKCLKRLCAALQIANGEAPLKSPNTPKHRLEPSRQLEL